jgi:hypothetical protein
LLQDQIEEEELDLDYTSQRILLKLMEAEYGLKIIKIVKGQRFHLVYLYAMD